MTEAPKTLALEPAEWGALAIFCVNAVGTMATQMAQQQGSILTEESASSLKQGLDRANNLIEAWRRSSQQRMDDFRRAQAAQSAQRSPVNVNGPVEPPKRKGGWPKGRARKSPESQVTN